MQTSFKGHIVTRQDVFNAMRDFDQKYAGTEEYIDWLSYKSHKYLVWNNGLQYPPKHILSLAIGISTTEFSGGEQTNRVFTDLGFVVVEIGGAKPSPGVLSSFASQLKSLFAGKRAESGYDFEEPVIPSFSVRDTAQEPANVHITPNYRQPHEPGTPIIETNLEIDTKETEPQYQHYEHPSAEQRTATGSLPTSPVAERANNNGTRKSDNY